MDINSDSEEEEDLISQAFGEGVRRKVRTEDEQYFQLTHAASAWHNAHPEVLEAVSSTGGAGGPVPGVVERLPVARRTEWTPSEDHLIRHGVQRLGCAWRVIAAQLPGRSDDAVRNRWNRLHERAQTPAVRYRSKRGEDRNTNCMLLLQLAGNEQRKVWTRAEDDIVMQSVTELGHKWFEIGQRLPGRRRACQSSGRR